MWYTVLANQREVPAAQVPHQRHEGAAAPAWNWQGHDSSMKPGDKTERAFSPATVSLLRNTNKSTWARSADPEDMILSVCSEAEAPSNASLGNL